METGTEISYRYSTLREVIVEHSFISKLLKHLWQKGVYDIEVARPEVDNTGVDLIVSRGSVVRHVQLKASNKGSSTAYQNVHIGLSSKPSGCVLWIELNLSDMEFTAYHWFGGKHGDRLPSLDGFDTATHTRGDSEGVKPERPNIRKIPKGQFEHFAVDQFGTIVERLLGPLP